MARYVYMTSNYTEGGLNLVEGRIYSSVYNITSSQSESVIADGSGVAMSHYTWALLDSEFDRRYG